MDARMSHITCVCHLSECFHDGNTRVPGKHQHENDHDSKDHLKLQNTLFVKTINLKIIARSDKNHFSLSLFHNKKISCP